jgi:ADP-ribose pyrophosphatase YjhB (NUDIX family)
MKNIKRYSGVLVKNKKEVLLCKRNNNGSHPGAWSIPAGKLDQQESPLHGAKREFYEETDFKLKDDLKLCGFVTRKTRDNLKDKGLMYVFLYETENEIVPNLEKAKDGEEHTECGYFNINNLPFEDDKDQLHILIKNILLKY